MKDEMTSNGLIDYVTCMNCGFEGTVKGGEDVCPKCDQPTLTWTDDIGVEEYLEKKEQS